MHAHLEAHFNCKILAWGEPSDDGDIYAATQHGCYVVASTAHLLLTALLPAPATQYALAA